MSDKVEKPPASVKLEYKLEVGEVRRYDVTTSGYGTVKLPGQTESAKLQTNTDLTFLQRVTKHNAADDTWNVKWELAKGSMTIKEFGDMPLQIPPMDVVMDKYGSVKEIKGLDQLPAVQGMPQDKIVGDVLNQLKSLGLPQKEIRLNDSWDQEYTVQIPGKKPLTIKAKSTFVSFESIMKMDCVRIRTAYEVPFVFPVGKSTAKAGSAAGSSSGSAEQVLKGTEKGEFWTYFAYKEGKVPQSHGIIELTADIASGEDAKAETTVASSTTAIGSVPAEEAKHDLRVRYDVVSTYNREPYKPAADKTEKVGKARKEQ